MVFLVVCGNYGGKSNQGFCNDDFGIDVFTDKLNDSRYQKTFRLEYVTGINTSGASTPSANGDYYAYNDERNKTYVWNEEQAAYFNEHILPTYNRPSWGVVKLWRENIKWEQEISSRAND